MPPDPAERSREDEAAAPDFTTARTDLATADADPVAEGMRLMFPSVSCSTAQSSTPMCGVTLKCEARLLHQAVSRSARLPHPGVPSVADF